MYIGQVLASQSSCVWSRSMWASWGEIVVVLGVGAMLYVQRTRARTRVYLRDCVRTAGAAGCRKRLHAADRRLLCTATELLRTCAVGSYGPKDLPRVAHAAGRTVGNAVAFLKKVSRPRRARPKASCVLLPAHSLGRPHRRGQGWTRSPRSTSCCSCTRTCGKV